ncbi:hypothetical protein [Kitasatospora aburaviensis]|uniref:Lipoprotein n=1 Tax=Kitasatospora aburaviensis TaxID=67265 RepID=A0ABW1F4G4_9ACTN
MATTVLALLLLLLVPAAGCSASPDPAGSAPGGSAPAGSAPADGSRTNLAPSARVPSPAPPAAPRPGWLAVEPLPRERLAAALLSAADLPAGSTTETVDGTPGAETTARYEKAAQRYPACAPIITVLAEQPDAAARRLYVTGNNARRNRTAADIGSFPKDHVRQRFDALAAAVSGGCSRFRLPGPGGDRELEVEAVPFEGLEAPAVGFRILSPTGALETTGGTTTVHLYAAVGDNRILFSKIDDTANHPTLPADLVTAQIHRLLTAPTPAPAATSTVTSIAMSTVTTPTVPVPAG